MTDPIPSDGEPTAEELRSAELVQRIEQGDDSAESELVVLYSRGIGYLLKHLTRDVHLADDLHQETFRVVIEKIRQSEIRQPERLSAFIRGIARNLWIGEWRKRKRRATEESVDNIHEPVDPSPSALGQAMLTEDRGRVRHLLKGMRSSRDREILFRFYISEESKDSVCSSLELSPSQFNVVLFRARQRFRQLLEEQRGEWA